MGLQPHAQNKMLRIKLKLKGGFHGKSMTENGF
jgi:hypothetical protein